MSPGPAAAAASDDFMLRRRPSNGPRRLEAASPWRQRRFAPQEILAKVSAWVALYGAPPITKDWEPSRARAAGHEWRARRFEDGDWPSVSMVRRQFGTFNAAIRAAGFEPQGEAPRHKPPLAGPEQVLAAIVEWTRRYGAPPSQTDWDAARARRTGQAWRIARYEQGDWPSLNTVRRHFGSLNRAIEEAGLRPRGAGQRRGRAPLVRVDVLRSLVSDPGESGSARARQLASAIRTVAVAGRARDHQRRRRALIELAGVALAWAEEIELP